MRLKTFTAKTMAEAMAEVRKTLGPDAIIVNTAQAGASGVRITAAFEGDPAPGRDADAPPPRPKPTTGSRLADLVAAADNLAFDHEVARLEDLLDHHRLPATMKTSLMRVARSVDADSAHMALAAALDNTFSFQPLGFTAPRPLMLVGTPGAGKTVSVAKIASAAAIAGNRVRLITTDTVRSGGVGQLEGFARLMRLDVIKASTPDDLADAVAGCVDADMILIDTAGCNPFSAEEIDRLWRFIDAVDAEPVLVAAAGGDCAEAEEIGEIFADLGCRRMVATRLDTARRYASLLAMAQSGPLAFAGVSATPYVAESVQSLNPVALARLMTARPKPVHPRSANGAHSVHPEKEQVRS
ncbi:MAG: hypothetical protein WEB93_03425 [Sphingomonadales bacterium]